MRPTFARREHRVGSPCANLGCTGTFRALTPTQRREYVANHPHMLPVNAGLCVGECDVCGLDVIGLKEVPTTEA